MTYKVVYSEELSHYGIKGQKWGVRRYQNPDGTRTEAGKKRYKGGSSLFDQTIKVSKDKSNISPAEKITKEASNITEKADNLRKTISESKKNKKTNNDISKLSDDELRRMVNRLNLEKQYKDLKKSDIETGKSKTEKIISIAKDVVSVGASAAAIIATINSLKHVDQDYYISHHGIKGQKWGEKNGPPYPLKDSAKTKEEKEADPDNTKYGMSADAAYAIAEIALSVGIVVASQVAAAKRDKQYIEQYYADREIDKLSDAKRMDPNKMSMEKHMASINPDYPGVGSTQNCMFCTTAMAMRMKGYDVSAEKCDDGWRPKSLEKNFEPQKVERIPAKTGKELDEKLAKQGDGAYGNLMLVGKYGGAHSVFYHIENGKAVIYDTQANEIMDVRSLKNIANLKASTYIRLDQSEPTEYVLGAVRNKYKKGEKAK